MSENEYQKNNGGFKLLAIRPLEGCDAQFRKNLKEGAVYKFYQDYDYYVTSNGNETLITDKNYEKFASKPISKVQRKKGAKDLDLYSDGDLKINISAVVGENGSGKSALIDFIYAAAYLLAEQNNLIKELEWIQKRRENPNMLLNMKGSNKAADLSYFKYSVALELFYQKGKTIYKVEKLYTPFDSELPSHTSIYEFQEDKFFVRKDERDYEPNKILEELFYSISLNYSLYGLNEAHHPWLKPLFHKNDAYKTPIVINPYRRDGIIDVNSELHLTQSRTILNLVDSNSDNPTLVNEKRVKEVKLTLNLFDNLFIKNKNYEEQDFYDVLDQFQEKDNLDIIDLFNAIASKLLNKKTSIRRSRELRKEIHVDKENIKKYLENTDLPGNFSLTQVHIEFQFVKYSIRKLFKICTQYPLEYGNEYLDKNNSTPIIKNLDGLLEKIKLDKSHAALKLKQAVVNVFSKVGFSSEWNFNDQKPFNNILLYSTFIPWRKFRKDILSSKNLIKQLEEEKLVYVPGAFYKPELLVVQPNDTVPYYFDQISSGEQQVSNAIQTIIYHINNLNSVHYSGNSERLKYNYLNICFDEIELYFHPRFQQTFVFNLLKSIKNLKDLKIEGINILFSTHSPFILSDIPSNNILRLENGIPKKDESQTFGANIHDLLANDFFLREGFMGEFAKEEIKSLIIFLDETKANQKDLNEKWSQKKSLGLIEKIGEPLLRNSLLELYRKKYCLPTYESLLNKYNDDQTLNL